MFFVKWLYITEKHPETTQKENKLKLFLDEKMLQTTYDETNFNDLS